MGASWVRAVGTKHLILVLLLLSLSFAEPNLVNTTFYVYVAGDIVNTSGWWAKVVFYDENITPMNLSNGTNSSYIWIFNATNKQQTFYNLTKYQRFCYDYMIYNNSSMNSSVLIDNGSACSTFSEYVGLTKIYYEGEENNLAEMLKKIIEMPFIFEIVVATMFITAVYMFGLSRGLVISVVIVVLLGLFAGGVLPQDKLSVALAVPVVGFVLLVAWSHASKRIQDY